MKKILTLAILILAGIVAAIALVLGAVIELVEGVLSMIFWFIIILFGYFFVKKKIKD
jgi:hypothetical protein